MITVPFSIAGPETVTTFAPTIANVPPRPVLFCCEPSLCAIADIEPHRHRDTERRRVDNKFLRRTLIFAAIFSKPPCLCVSVIKILPIIGYLHLRIRHCPARLELSRSEYAAA